MLLVKMKLHWLRMGPKSNDLCLYRRERRRRFRLRQTDREDDHVKRDTEIGLRLPQVWENRRPSEAETAKEQFFPRAFRWSMDGPADPLTLDFRPLEL